MKAETSNPSQKMIEAGFLVLRDSGITEEYLDSDKLMIADIYRAMFAASEVAPDVQSVRWNDMDDYNVGISPDRVLVCAIDGDEPRVMLAECDSFGRWTIDYEGQLIYPYAWLPIPEPVGAP
jgi:hypothetical protein